MVVVDGDDDDDDDADDDDIGIMVGAFLPASLFSLRFLCPEWPSLLSAHNQITMMMVMMMIYI